MIDHQRKSTVSLVGAGPGDVELLTLRAVARLRDADVVLYDELASRDALAFCRPDARLINVGKIGGGRATSQDVINALLAREAKAGNFVVRLKGGDPFVFGRGGEEALYLARHGVTVEIVPGVSCAVAAAQSAAIPVTHRGLATHFTVVTGFSAAADDSMDTRWSLLAKAGGTLVVLMPLANLDRIVAALSRSGLAPTTPVALVERATLQNQRVTVTTLDAVVATAAREGVVSPCTVVVGEVVRLRENLAPFIAAYAPLTTDATLDPEPLLAASA